jgi:hypothetical protein
MSHSTDVGCIFEEKGKLAMSEMMYDIPSEPGPGKVKQFFMTVSYVLFVLAYWAGWIGTYAHWLYEVIGSNTSIGVKVLGVMIGGPFLSSFWPLYWIWWLVFG